MHQTKTRLGGFLFGAKIVMLSALISLVKFRDLVAPTDPANQIGNPARQ